MTYTSPQKKEEKYPLKPSSVGTGQRRTDKHTARTQNGNKNTLTFRAGPTRGSASLAYDLPVGEREKKKISLINLYQLLCQKKKREEKRNS